MNLKLTVKLAVAAAAAAVPLIASAFPAIPTQPAPIPSGGLPNNSLSSDPVYAAVWDPITGASDTVYLGLNAGQIAASSTDAVNGTFGFGQLSGFSTAFASEISAGTTGSLLFEVFSTSTNGTVTSIYTTSANAASDTAFNGIAGNQANGAAGAQAANTTINTWTVSRMNAGSPNCAATNPCIAPSNTDPRSWALAAFADNYGGALNGIDPNLHTSTTLGNAMSFFLLSGDNSNPFSPTASASQYAGKWLIDTAGQLSYQVGAVPLPAAGWLLLSGLLGLGAVGRRRALAAPVAA
jgi:hypothetical protein